MKIITLHCDYIRFKALKKAVKSAEPTDSKEVEVKEPLVVLTAIEQGDSKDTIHDLVQAIEKTAKDVKTNTVVLYPYAHLSNNLANPKIAQEYLKEAQDLLKKSKSIKKITRAPFGYYKSFELKCKGHPLSELSKEFKSQVSSPGKIQEEEYDIKNLLREISRSKLDTSKLKDNDHRILGQRLDLYSFNEVAPGMVFWHDAGLHVYNKLKDLMTELLRQNGYQIVSTPQILDSKLFKVSGHWDHYQDHMFMTSYDDRPFGIKPMNCPGGMLVYKSNPRSYKDLPLRMAEFGIDHRKELSGVLAGLFRVIQFTQDDAHVFCNKKQIGDEVKHMLEMVDTVYRKTFGFKYSFELSTRPEKFMGEKKDWDDAEKILQDVLKKSKAKFRINKGDGAFYGPKIDLHIKDSLGRGWQCATIQLDMQMPKRFELTYTGKDNKEKTPFVIHRAIFGSIERFIGVLIEHLSGNLPLWLSPRQVCIINFTDKQKKNAEKLAQDLQKEIPGLRIHSDLENTTVQAKIRQAELMKYNYIIVIGDKEVKSKTLAVRPRGGKPKFGVKPATFIEDLKKEIASKKQ